jgi:hypothetical protein
MKLIIHFYPAPRLMICGTMLPLHISEWHVVPHFIHKVPLHDVKVGIWCALNARRIMDPVLCAEILRCIRHLTASESVTFSLMTLLQLTI